MSDEDGIALDSLQRGTLRVAVGAAMASLSSRRIHRCR